MLVKSNAAKVLYDTILKIYLRYERKTDRLWGGKKFILIKKDSDKNV